jgi:Carboxypeptidase regulatory-like domain
VSYKGVRLSVFTIDGKNRNGRIVNRYPDYGDGHLDGCIIMPEMRVDIYRKDKFKHITGLVRNVSDNSVLHNANVTVKTADNRKVNVTTDRDGKFEVVSDQPILSLQVKYVGYRGFYVSLQTAE